MVKQFKENEGCFSTFIFLDISRFLPKMFLSNIHVVGIYLNI